MKPGGPADTRELDSLTITKVAVDEQMSNNCYLLTCKHTGEAVLIDAAAASDTLLGLIGSTPVYARGDHPPALGPPPRAGRRRRRDRAPRPWPVSPTPLPITEQTGVPVTIEVGDGDTVPVGTCTLW